MLLRTLPYTLIFILIFSCSDSNGDIEAKEGVVTSTLSREPLSEEEIKKIEEEEKKRQAEYEASLTTIEFDKVYHDFGNVLPDSDNTTKFIIKNTGNQPLIVENVAASCGCTTPTKPEGPIAPGASDIIEVTFHPKPNQKNEIKKTVTVTANTKDKVHKLDIRAFVTE